MRITVDGKNLTSVLSAITTHTKAAHANLVCAEDKVFVVASGSGVFLRLAVDGCKVEEAGSGLTFNVVVLSNLIKGRGKFTITHAKDEPDVKFSSAQKGHSKYDGTMVVLPKEDLKIALPTKSKDIELSAELHSTILDAINHISIRDIYTGSDMFAAIECTRSGFAAAAYDKYHLASYHNPNVKSKENISIVLPIASFQIIASLVGDSPYKLRLTESSIIVQSSDFFIMLPLAQSDYTVDIVQAKTFYNDCLNIKPDAVFEIRSEAVTNTLNNMFGVYEEKSAVKVSHKDSSVTFGLSTNYGNIRETFKVAEGLKWAGTTTFNIDPNLLHDLLLHIDGKNLVKFSFVKDKYVFIRVNGEKDQAITFYFCSLQ